MSQFSTGAIGHLNFSSTVELLTQFHFTGTASGGGCVCLF